MLQFELYLFYLFSENNTQFKKLCGLLLCSQDAANSAFCVTFPKKLIPLNEKILPARLTLRWWITPGWAFETALSL
jgi:hypothetical protein